MSPDAPESVNSEYLRYVERTSALVRDTLDEMQCQTIFFVGSGIPKRYYGSPSWIELLKEISMQLGLVADEFNYLMQKHDNDAISLGQELQERAFEWAWKGGKSKFPNEYYNTDVHRAQFLKHMACGIIS